MDPLLSCRYLESAGWTHHNHDIVVERRRTRPEDRKRMHEQRMYQCATAVEECEGGEEDNSMREGLGRSLDGERRISHHQITF